VNLETKDSDNVDALIQIAFGDDEAASTAVIRKLFLGGGMTKGSKPAPQPTADQLQASADRERLNQLRAADPRVQLEWWSGVLVNVRRYHAAQRLNVVDVRHLEHATVEDAAADITPPAPTEALIPELPSPPSPQDICHCQCKRAVHESNGGCMGCGRCSLFVARDEAFAIRQDNIRTHGGLRP
jgi:hypothetical protein